MAPASVPESCVALATMVVSTVSRSTLVDRPRHLAKRAQLGNRLAQALLTLGQRGGEEIGRFGHVGDFVVSRNQDRRCGTISRATHVVAELLQARDD